MNFMGEIEFSNLDYNLTFQFDLLNTILSNHPNTSVIS